MTPSAWLRKIGAGRLLYRGFHQPLGRVKLARRYGWNLILRAAWGEWAMRRAARTLRPPAPCDQTPVMTPVCLLTGRRFIHQTLFCLHSLASHSGPIGGIEILSDGSLTEQDAQSVRRLWPAARIRHAPELNDIVSTALPASRFPVLHTVRREFVMLRKLTDSMAGQRGYRVLFDSDMLFWRRPDELLNHLAASEPCYMRDIADDSYTVPRAEITRRFGLEVAVGVNGGLVALDATRIDWDLVEQVCGFLRGTTGDQRLLEQTLWGVLLGCCGARALDPTQYRLLIDPVAWASSRQAPAPAALLHYAWHARLPYLAGEWRRYLATLPVSQHA